MRNDKKSEEIEYTFVTERKEEKGRECERIEREGVKVRGREGANRTRRAGKCQGKMAVTVQLCDRRAAG